MTTNDTNRAAALSARVAAELLTADIADLHRTRRRITTAVWGIAIGVMIYGAINVTGLLIDHGVWPHVARLLSAMIDWPCRSARRASPRAAAAPVRAVAPTAAAEGDSGHPGRCDRPRSSTPPSSSPKRRNSSPGCTRTPSTPQRSTSLTSTIGTPATASTNSKAYAASRPGQSSKGICPATWLCQSPASVEGSVKRLRPGGPGR
jgi:hypothetical protein